MNLSLLRTPCPFGHGPRWCCDQNTTSFSLYLSLQGAGGRDPRNEVEQNNEHPVNNWLDGGLIFVILIYNCGFLVQIDDTHSDTENHERYVREKSTLIGTETGQRSRFVQVPIYIHDSYTGKGVQLELWAWVFNAVRVSVQSSFDK